MRSFIQNFLTHKTAAIVEFDLDLLDCKISTSDSCCLSCRQLPTIFMMIFCSGPWIDFDKCQSREFCMAVQLTVFAFGFPRRLPIEEIHSQLFHQATRKEMPPLLQYRHPWVEWKLTLVNRSPVGSPGSVSNCTQSAASAKHPNH